MKKFNKLLSLLIAAVMMALCVAPSLVTEAEAAGKWVSTWASSIVNGSVSISALSLQDVIPSKSTVRIELTVTTGGTMLSFRFSNQYGAAAITISGASVAKTDGDGTADIIDGTQTPILFDGEQSVTIPAGETIWSDSVRLKTAALERLSISLYFDNLTYITSTGLSNGRSFLSTNLLSLSQNRSQIDSVKLPNISEINISSGTITYHTIPFLAAINTYSTADNPSTAVFIGDSTLVNDTFLHFARKLAAAGHEEISIINQAIVGNKLLSPGSGLIGNLYGDALIDRFARDVLEVTNVKYCFVKIGLNDIIHQNTKSLSATTPKYNANDIISGYRTLIKLCHANGIKIYFFTKSPWKGYERSFLGQSGDLTWTYTQQKVCNELDNWIKTNSEADGYIDCWDLANPADPYALCPSFSVDGVHLTDLAAVALADLIPVEYVGVSGDGIKTCAEIEGVSPYAEKNRIIREMSQTTVPVTEPPENDEPENDEPTTASEPTTVPSGEPATSPNAEPQTSILLPVETAPVYNETTTDSQIIPPQNIDVNYNVIDDVTSIGGDTHIVFILVMFTAVIISSAIVILTIGKRKEEI